ncbi:TIGR01244 family sulfur transferase [Oceanomicrobium pacificus]|uniref:TIGR01244 family phosphatase n=1 Tax=Oceanomicrobium pacificus TaxID=2692916 RepID=A0A6B0TRB8_9RHOB|nr:TIGR01244 family sulfur transferase [Oceanomicrobium pacificus]MXU64288.1 TIGR01244 family phosphatase [Oceanomicrobium pacificus]
MLVKSLTETFSVAPQIAAEEVSHVAQTGFTTLVNNRPDGEVPDGLQSADMAAAAERAGLAYHYIPIVPGQMGPAEVAALRDVIKGASGPILAYCRSGTRSATLWALAEAPTREAGEIVDRAAKAGYDLSGMQPMLAAQAAG